MNEVIINLIYFLIKTPGEKLMDTTKDKDSGILISRYEEEGCRNRAEYLDMLREDYGADIVDALTSVLPPSEDFDGLITELQDQSNYY